MLNASALAPTSPDCQVRRLRPALGTWVAVEAAGESPAVTQLAVESAFAAVADIEARMHPVRAGSDVARINAAAIGELTPIHASTARVLQLAQRLGVLTDGVFDPCLPSAPGRLADLELGLSSQGACVRIHARVALDFGGIAKGYAVDCAIDALLAAGCSAGLVNAGGDLRLFGPMSQTILLRRQDGSLLPLELSDSALAVSDRDAARRPPEHRGYYRRPSCAVEGRRYAAVIAADAVTADALTKCLLLCAEERAREVLGAFGAREAA